MRLTTDPDVVPPPKQFLGLHPIRWIGIGLLLAVLVLWDGYRRVPTLAAQGDSLNGTSFPFDKPVLRVGTFNIDGGVGTDDRFDLHRIADCMRGCDLLGLQEVHGGSWFDKGDQARALGEDLKLPWLYAPAETRWWRPSFGNAVIADLPVVSWERFPVSGLASSNNRALLITHFRWGNQPLHALIVHLPTTYDRPAQCAMVESLFFAFEKPALLIGDLNTRPGDPWIEKLRHHEGVADAVGTYAEKQMPNHVDWIFARGLACVGGGMIDQHASDHPFYWGDFRKD
jgi:endonuclease/exonuclease/phosphatase family metal-dependent hydrolase